MAKCRGVFSQELFETIWFFNYSGWHAAHFSQEVFDFIRFFQHGENADQFFQDVSISSDFSHFGFWAGRSAAHFFLSPIFQILASQQEKILPILPKIYFFQSVSDHSSSFGFPLRNVADPWGWVVKPHMATTKARILWGGWWNPKRRLGHLVTTIRVNGLHVFAWTEWMSETFAHDGQVQRCFSPKNFLRQLDSSTIGFITGWHAAHFSQEIFDFIRFFQHGENADQFFQDVSTSSDFSHFGFWAGRSAAHFFLSPIFQISNFGFTTGKNTAHSPQDLFFYNPFQIILRILDFH